MTTIFNVLTDDEMKELAAKFPPRRGLAPREKPAHPSVVKLANDLFFRRTTVWPDFRTARSSQWRPPAEMSEEKKAQLREYAEAKREKRQRQPGAPRHAGRGIGALVVSLLAEGMETATIVAEVKKRIPGARTSAASVAWYKNKLRSDGARHAPDSGDKNDTSRAAGSSRSSSSSAAAATGSDGREAGAGKTGGAKTRGAAGRAEAGREKEGGRQVAEKGGKKGGEEKAGSARRGAEKTRGREKAQARKKVGRRA
jgi:hypothetical protein